MPEFEVVAYRIERYETIRYVEAETKDQAVQEVENGNGLIVRDELQESRLSIHSIEPTD